MRPCAPLMLLLLLLGVALPAPVDQSGPQEASCSDPQVLGAAHQAINKINHDRVEGYKFAMERLTNAHLEKHGENAILFYLTMNVVETNCSVLNRDSAKSSCQPRPDHDTPVYGQCNVAIYISRVNRVVRLYKYQCAVRPVPAERLTAICPDCPSMMTNNDDDEVKKAVTLSLEKFNQESGLSKRFALLKLNRARSGYGMAMYYNVEFTIQETTCTKDKTAADDCPLMDCEFSHKGFCLGSLMYTSSGDAETSVSCDIYEPEAAEAEKKLHLLGGETDHSHSDTHTHDHAHDHDHPVDSMHSHDHMHDHTKSHNHHDRVHKHGGNDDHHHTHDHAAGSAHRHAHDHSHDHGHNHDHVHAHHAKAHDHSGDSPGHHHDYKHPVGTHTHEHDHELALDHDHKHAHLHEHEHHHHHHDHVHETSYHDNPMGVVKMLPPVGQPVTMPIFDNTREVAVTLQAKPDPQIPEMLEPTIGPFPTSASTQCAAPLVEELTLVVKMFKEDSLFNGSV